MSVEYKICPKDYRKNLSLIIFLSVFGGIWGIGTVFGVITLSRDFSTEHFLIVLACGGVCSLTVLFMLTANSPEVISIDDSDIVMSHYNGRRKIKMPIAELQKLLLENTDSGGANLFFVNKEGTKVLPIAPFVSLEDKRCMLNDIGLFLKSNGVAIEMVDMTTSHHESESS